MTYFPRMLILLALVGCLTGSHGKLIKSTAKINRDKPIAFVARFSTDPGTSTFMLRSRMSHGDYTDYNDKRTVVLNIYTEEEWADGKFTCEPRPTHRRINVELPGDGGWAKRIYETIEHENEPIVWYFTFSDCYGEMGKEGKIRFDLELKNSDEAHFSTEHKGMLIGYFVVAIIFLVFFVAISIKIMGIGRRNELLDPNLYTLLVSTGLQVVFAVTKIIDLYLVHIGGRGHNTIQFLSTSSEFIAQLGIMFVFLIISDGWSLFSTEFPNPELYIPGMIMLGSFEMIVAGLGRLLDDTHAKFTDHDGPAGWYHMMLRLLIIAWFLYNLKNIKDDEGANMTYRKNFKFLGLIYMLSMPILQLSSLALPGYLRYRVVMLGLSVVQVFVTIYFYLLFSMDRANRGNTLVEMFPPKTHDN